MKKWEKPLMSGLEIGMTARGKVEVVNGYCCECGNYVYDNFGDYKASKHDGQCSYHHQKGENAGLMPLFCS